MLMNETNMCDRYSFILPDSNQKLTENIAKTLKYNFLCKRVNFIRCHKVILFGNNLMISYVYRHSGLN